jgi:hypothetical protein
MYRILLFFKRLKENEERKFISINGMTFRIIRRSQGMRNKNVIRKMDEVSDYQAFGNVLTEYVKIE